MDRDVLRKAEGVVEQEVAPDGSALEPTVGAPSVVEKEEAGRRVRSRADLPVNVGTIMALAMPTLVEQLISAGVGCTDTIVGGHTGHTDAERTAAAAAVGAMTYLQWLASLTTAAFSVGAIAIVSRAIGAHRPRLANRVAGTAFVAAFLAGMVIAVLFWILARPLVAMFSLEGLAAEYGVTYMRIMCLTICFQSAGQMGMACLRGAGDTIRPLIVTIAVVVMNFFASAGLAFGWFGLPELGVRGNALGTLLAFVVAGIATTMLLISGRAGLKLRARHFRIVPHLLARVAKIAVPSWIENLLLWGGQSAIALLVMRQVDRAVGISGVTLAAHNATLRIESLAFLPGFGFGMACSALVGQYLGAKKPEEARHAAVLCGRMALGTMSLAALPMIFFPGMMLRWMVDAGSVVEMGIWPLILAGLAQPGFAVAITNSSALRGAGETKWPMISTMTGMGMRVILVVPAAYYLSSNGHAAWGLIAVWICIFLDLNYRAVFTSVIFAKGKWKEQRV